ncbi:MAG: bactofilin family protein [bacterium JZ-2024 1]
MMKKQTPLQATRAIALLLFVSAYFTDIKVEEGEVVSRVHLIFGEVYIKGTVTGDVKCSFCELTIAPSGVVQGNVSAHFANVSSKGEIHDISLSQSSARISGKVLGNMKIRYANMELEKNALVSGNINSYRSKLEVSGKVAGTVEAQESNVKLSETAEIAGNLVLIDSNFEGNEEQVTGGITRKEAPHKPRFRLITPLRLPSLFGKFILLLLTLLIVFIFYQPTEFSQKFSTREQAGLSLLAGFLAIMALIPLLLLLMVSIVGIPLIFIVVPLYVGGLFFGWAVLCRKTGNWFFSLFRMQVHDLLDTFVGFVLLTLLTVIPLVGGVFFLFFCVLSLGIFTRYLWMIVRQKSTPAPQPTG